MFILTQMKTIVTTTVRTDFFYKSIKFFKDDKNFAKFTSYCECVTRPSGLSYWTLLIIKAHMRKDHLDFSCAMKHKWTLGALNKKSI